MIWHQIIWNGLQNTVLTWIAVLIILVLVEEAFITTTVFSLISEPTPIIRTTGTSYLLGQHFICNMKEEIKDQKTKKHMSLKIHMFLLSIKETTCCTRGNGELIAWGKVTK